MGVIYLLDVAFAFRQVRNALDEHRDRLRYRMNKDKQYYDLHGNEEYINRLDEIKMKRFYGRHPSQYMTKRENVLARDGIYGNTKFASLAVTGFHNKPGWESKDR